jgi:hypothetical protein
MLIFCCLVSLPPSIQMSQMLHEALGTKEPILVGSMVWMVSAPEYPHDDGYYVYTKGSHAFNFEEDDILRKQCVFVKESAAKNGPAAT